MEYSCNLSVFGESSVGKTCILSRYISGIYEDDHHPSTGPTLGFKSIEIEGESLKLELWDTAGQEKYRSLNKMFYKNADIVLFVYDITNRKSFEEIREYYYELTRELVPEYAIFGIAGNKCDKFNNEAVSENEAKEFATSIGAEFGLHQRLKIMELMI